MEKFIIEGFIDPVDDVETEDGGAAIIATIGSDIEDEGMFIKLQSWDEKAYKDINGGVKRELHKDINKFIGKTVRITVEVIEDLEEDQLACDNDFCGWIGSRSELIPSMDVNISNPQDHTLYENLVCPDCGETVIDI